MDNIPTVMVIGDINVDMIFPLAAYPTEGAEIAVSSVSTRLGGSGCNTASVLARLGVHTRLIGRVGADPFGQFALDEIVRTGIDPSLILKTAPDKTGTMVVEVTQGGQRTIFGFRGCNVLPCDPTSLEQDLLHVDLLHVSGYTFLNDLQWEATTDLIYCARRLGKLVTFDPGGDAPFSVPQRVLDILPDLDVLLASQMEILALARSDDLEVAIETLRKQTTGILAVKLGCQGSRIVRGNTQVCVAPYKGKAVTDTTGAGDCFNAGFIWGILNHLPLSDSARLGNAIAYLSITSGDGIAAIHHLPNIKSALKSLVQIQSLELLFH